MLGGEKKLRSPIFRKGRGSQEIGKMSHNGDLASCQNWTFTTTYSPGPRSSTPGWQYGSPG